MWDLTQLQHIFPSLSSKSTPITWKAYGGETYYIGIHKNRIARIKHQQSLRIAAEHIKTHKGKSWLFNAQTQAPDLSSLTKIAETIRQNAAKTQNGQAPPTASPRIDSAPEGRAYHVPTATAPLAVALHRAYQAVQSLQKLSIHANADLHWQNGAFTWNQQKTCFAFHDATTQLCHPLTVIEEIFFLTSPNNPHLTLIQHDRLHKRNHDTSGALKETAQKLTRLQSLPTIALTEKDAIHFGPYAMAQILHFCLQRQIPLAPHPQTVLLDDFSHPQHQAPGFTDTASAQSSRPISPQASYPCLVSAASNAQRASNAAPPFTTDFVQCLPDAILFPHGLYNDHYIAPPCMLFVAPPHVITRAVALENPQNIRGIVAAPHLLTLKKGDLCPLKN